MSKSLFSYFKKTPKKESPSLKKLETPKSRSEETKRKNNDEISKREFVEGDIVWAKLNDFPYWPGMICLDPKKNVSMVKEKGITKFHVQFFGDPPTHDLVDKSYIKEFKDMKPDEKDKEQQVAYKQAECAINIPPSERVEKLYACIDSSEDDDEAMTSDKENLTENEEDVLAQSRKRSRTSANGKPRKRMKMIDSDSEDDSGNDSTYKPDENDASDDDDYKSDSQMESESPIDNDDSDHESPPKKKKSLSTPKPIKGKSTVKNISSPFTPLSNKKMNSSISSPITPLSSKKINASISNVQSKLSQFSSPGANTSSSDLTIDTELTYTHMKLSFLEDGKRKDKRGKLHTHPEYDPRTLCVPDSYINSKEVTPGMKQWWTLKRDLYDTIIFFKVGKFYELYHMDAVVGVKELGLTYMKGKFAHCGFPEIAFSRYSEVLVQRGFKVARIEQTETPQTMSERSAKVVRREVCAIISKGTRTFSFMEGATDETTSAYLLSIVEKPCNDICLGGSLFGVCFVDTSIGKFYIGQFKDDRQCSRFLTMVAQYPPVQVLYQRGGISAKLNHIMNHELITTIKEVLHPGTEFWDSSKTLKHFHDNDYFTDENSNASIAWPPILKQMIAEGDTLGLAASEEYEHAVSALGACTWYLNKCQIAEELISMQKFEEFVPTDNLTKRVQKNSMAKYMILDGVTLTNLDIVINNDGNTNGTLLELLDHCATPFGKRFFKQWLCSPLCQKSSIENRLNAVEDLMKCSSLINECRNIMRSLPDLERILRRIHSLGSVKRSKDHPDSRAIMYNEETYSKKKISDLISAFEGFNKTYKVMKMFEENIDSFSSSSFKRLLLKNDRNDIGMFPDLLPSLKFYQHAFNHKVAKETGLIHPKAGVVVEYDRALAEIDCIKEKLNNYLKQQKKRMGCNSIVYWGTGKNRYQLEIPEAALRSHTPNDYHLKSQKKGYKRYQSNVIESLVEELTKAEEKRDCALKDTMREIFHKFDSEYPMWEKAVSCLATIDCLMSLAYYSLNIDGVSCRPEIVDLTTDDGDDVRPFFELINCRHPCITLLPGNDFIPNDIILGESEQNEETENSEKPASCLLITGPNMGGKSTLMRQTGVILIMAQLGCYVPAEVCRFTPVDRVFTRLGARDRILHGESTFFVELSETSVIFQHATKHSLVLLDELGRGTATYDGTAIASAVVHELSKTIGCRTLFSTHYHTLVEEFANAENIKLGHMACMVEKEDDANDDDDPSTDTITFLYKFAHGACPKSYGFNAAKLAGLPISVIKSAHEKAKEFEKSTVNMRKLRSILHCNVSDITKMMTSLIT